MAFAPHSSASSQPGTPKSRRAASFLLALVIHALLIFLLLRLAPELPVIVKMRPQPVTFDLSPDAEDAAPEAPEPEKEEEREEQAEASKPQPAPAPVPRPPVETRRPDPVQPPALPFVVISRRDLAAGDIASVPPAPRSSAAAESSASASAGSDSRASAGPGEGPGGQPLFAADWYRKPTHAELSYYMPANPPPSGWGLVACQTVEKFRVDNCQPLGESPPGSGFARAVRQAAWQFMVRPPRVGGQPLIGAWVRIRIDYTQGKAAEVGG